MATDIEDKKIRAYNNRRSIMDYGMGILYSVAGIFIFIYSGRNSAIPFLSGSISYLFGSLCIIYGGFRIYRGYKKNYYHQEISDED